MLDNQPLNGPSNYKMNSHNELISQKNRRVKLMELLKHLRNWKYLSLMALIDLNWMVEFFLLPFTCDIEKKIFCLLFKVFKQFYLENFCSE